MLYPTILLDQNERKCNAVSNIIIYLLSYKICHLDTHLTS